MRTCWLAAVLLSAAAACGVGTQGCSSTLSGSSTSTVPAGPAPAPAAGLLTPAGQATLAAAEDLSTFVPLLAQPQLSWSKRTSRARR